MIVCGRMAELFDIYKSCLMSSVNNLSSKICIHLCGRKLLLYLVISVFVSRLAFLSAKTKQIFHLIERATQDGSRKYHWHECLRLDCFCQPIPERIVSKSNANHPYYLMRLYLVVQTVKGKAVPLQAWRGPEGSKKLRFPYYMTTAQDGGKVVSPTHRPPLPPGKAPGTHFC